MTVITVCRQVGCEGRYIAEHVAQTMGYHFADYKTVEMILREYGLIEFPEVYKSPPGFRDYFTALGSARESISIMLPKINLALARHGNVVMLGRGVFASLQGMHDVLNVRLKASLSTRINRIMRDYQISAPHEAEEFIKERDMRVTGYTRDWYGVSTDDATLFDLVIDTSKVDPDLALGWIVEAANAVEQRRDDVDGASTREIQVNPILAQVVADQFQCRIEHP